MPRTIPTAGQCDCGGRHMVDPDTVDDDTVRFPCNRDGCDWERVMSQQHFQNRVEEMDVDLDALRDQGVPA